MQPLEYSIGRPRGVPRDCDNCRCVTVCPLDVPRWISQCLRACVFSNRYRYGAHPAAEAGLVAPMPTQSSKSVLHNHVHKLMHKSPHKRTSLCTTACVYPRRGTHACARVRCHRVHLSTSPNFLVRLEYSPTGSRTRVSSRIMARIAPPNCFSVRRSRSLYCLASRGR